MYSNKILIIDTKKSGNKTLIGGNKNEKEMSRNKILIIDNEMSRNKVKCSQQKIWYPMRLRKQAEGLRSLKMVTKKSPHIFQILYAVSLYHGAVLITISNVQPYRI